MAVSGNYGDYTYNNGNRDIRTVADDNGKNRTAGNSNLGMNDFLTLLAAQMSNQDMMNPSSDTDFIAQMAQFSALQGVNTISEYVLSSYAVSYTGKHVIISHINEVTQQLETVYGKVERITFMNGEPKVVVEGKEYDLHTVMEIAEHEIRPPNESAKELIGKYVAVEVTNEKTGKTETYFGKVEKAAYYNDKDHIMINNTFYPVENVTQVSDEEINAGNYNPDRKPGTEEKPETDTE